MRKGSANDGLRSLSFLFLNGLEPKAARCDDLVPRRRDAGVHAVIAILTIVRITIFETGEIRLTDEFGAGIDAIAVERVTVLEAAGAVAITRFDPDIRFQVLPSPGEQRPCRRSRYASKRAAKSEALGL